jgi:hypothetical protein
VIQYTDDTFGEIKPLRELLSELMEVPEIAWDTIKCIHIGSADKLKRVKTTEERLTELEAEIEKFKELHPTSKVIIIPSEVDLKRFSLTNKEKS